MFTLSLSVTESKQCEGPDNNFRGQCGLTHILQFCGIAEVATVHTIYAQVEVKIDKETDSASLLK